MGRLAVLCLFLLFDVAALAAATIPFDSTMIDGFPINATRNGLHLAVLVPCVVNPSGGYEPDLSDPRLAESPLPTAGDSSSCRGVTYLFAKSDAPDGLSSLLLQVNGVPDPTASIFFGEGEYLMTTVIGVTKPQDYRVFPSVIPGIASGVRSIVGFAEVNGHTRALCSTTLNNVEDSQVCGGGQVTNGADSGKQFQNPAAVTQSSAANSAEQTNSSFCPFKASIDQNPTNTASIWFLILGFFLVSIPLHFGYRARGKS